jgi:hypothetical protein
MHLHVRAALSYLDRQAKPMSRVLLYLDSILLVTSMPIQEVDVNQHLLPDGQKTLRR